MGALVGTLFQQFRNKTNNKQHVNRRYDPKSDHLSFFMPPYKHLCVCDIISYSGRANSKVSRFTIIVSFVPRRTTSCMLLIVVFLNQIIRLVFCRKFVNVHGEEIPIRQTNHLVIACTAIIKNRLISCLILLTRLRLVQLAIGYYRQEIQCLSCQKRKNAGRGQRHYFFAT